MAIVSIATLKSYFETGDFPTQSQFEDLIDTLSYYGSLTGLSDGLAAAGATQATATAVSVATGRIDTVAAGTGVKPSVTATKGFRQTIQNNGANDLNYYPFLGNNFYTIGSGASAANAPVVIAPGNQVSVICYTAGTLTII